MSNKLGFKPWFSIWVKPRATISNILTTDRTRCFYCISFVYGFQYIMSFAQLFSWGKSIDFYLIGLIALVLALPIGVILISIVSFVMYYLGKLLGGKGDYKEVRTAVSWAYVTAAVSTLVWIALFIIYKGAIFYGSFPAMHAQTVTFPFYAIAMVIQVVVGIWSVVIMCNTLSVVQRYSVWLGLLNILMTSILLGVLFYVGVYCYNLLF